MAVTLLSSEIQRTINDCSEDDIGCDNCQLFSTCDNFLSNSDRWQRSEREIVEGIRELRFWKHYFGKLEDKHMTKTAVKPPQYVIDRVKDRYCCGECGGELTVRQYGPNNVPECPAHPQAEIVRKPR